MAENTETSRMTDSCDGETNKGEVGEQESNDTDSPNREIDNNLIEDMEQTEPEGVDSQQEGEGAAVDKRHCCHSDHHSGATMSREIVTTPEEGTGEDYSEENKESAMTEESETCSTSVDQLMDGCKAPDNDRTPGIGTEDEDEENRDGVQNVLVSERTYVFNDNTKSRQYKVDMGRSTNVTTLGSTTQEISIQPTGVHGGITKYILVALLVVALAVALRPSSPPEQKDEGQVDIFLRKLENMKSRFPSQHPELWRRSRIHLERHLQTAQPREPASLMLTAGRKGERTLRCLAHGLASAFSSALNASALHIDGASMASQDSDQVKLDIDSQLRGAFEANKPVAVIHRFEALPPGSTLIFYRYCDHENAAYKRVFLAFTVLLEGEEELPALLSDVEEMVDDHLQRKFLSAGHPVKFDTMDLNKYGGLWSRISHLILPVAAEDGMEQSGCSDTKLK